MSYRCSGNSIVERLSFLLLHRRHVPNCQVVFKPRRQSDSSLKFSPVVVRKAFPSGDAWHPFYPLSSLLSTVLDVSQNLLIYSTFRSTSLFWLADAPLVNFLQQVSLRELHETGKLHRWSFSYGQRLVAEKYNKSDFSYFTEEQFFR